MEKPVPSDPELLAEWHGQHREAAFRELVARYAGLVHATALRTCGESSMAAEASQLTFIALAGKARSLTTCASLGGWLHTTAIMQAKNLLRKSLRENRKRQQLQATMDPASPDAIHDSWKELRPLLDEALSSLPAKDREAILLRFYRSLSIREIATTLGIATAAAQKRVDRATERLRDKLARRGVQAGGSLGAVMLAGFATDAQAASALVPVLTAKSLAAASVGSGGLASVITQFATIAMKTVPTIPAAAVLLAAGVWLVNQRQSIATVERQNLLLHQQLDGSAATVSSSEPRGSSIRTELDRRPVDWYRVARQLEAGASSGADRRIRRSIEAGFLAMDRDELVQALDEVGAAGLPARYRGLLEAELVHPLVEKDPEYCLKRYMEREYIPGSSQVEPSGPWALHFWTKAEPLEAVAWMDEQIAAGMFGNKSPNGRLYARIQMEQALTSALMDSDPDAAGRRLAALPETERINVVSGDLFRGVWSNPEHSLAFANLLRQQLPEKDCLDAIAWPVSRLGEGGTVQFSQVHDYMKRIGAKPVERERCILAMTSRFPLASGSFGKVSNGDIDALRAWVATEEPALVDRATTAAVRGFQNNFGFETMAGIALHSHGMNGDDNILVTLLADYQAPEHKELARALAAALRDDKLRSQYLEQLK